MLKDLLLERARLERELDKIEAYRKLTAILKAIEVYEAASHPAESARRRSTSREAASQARRAAADACYALLEGETRPVKTADLDRALAGRGVALAGTDPVSALSAALSTDARFKSSGRRGWLRRADAPSPAGPPPASPGDQDSDPDVTVLPH